jgi:hypothetical protein
VVTKDGYVPFLRRSNAVGILIVTLSVSPLLLLKWDFLHACNVTGEGAGMMALPGGHAEPSKLGISSIEQFEEESAPFVAQEALMHELFDRCAFSDL